MDVLVTCKYEEDPIKMKLQECSQQFPHYNPMGAICCLGNQSSKPHTNDASDKIWLQFAHWLRRFSSLKMFTDRQTATQTDDGSTGIL